RIADLRARGVGDTLPELLPLAVGVPARAEVQIRQFGEHDCAPVREAVPPGRMYTHLRYRLRALHQGLTNEGNFTRQLLGIGDVDLKRVKCGVATRRRGHVVTPSEDSEVQQ